jgi:hypothetical protein
MDAAVHDQAVDQDETRASGTRSSPGAGDAPTRQTIELDDIVRKASEASLGNKPIVSSSGESKARRRGDALCEPRGFCCAWQLQPQLQSLRC